MADTVQCSTCGFISAKLVATFSGLQVPILGQSDTVCIFVLFGFVLKYIVLLVNRLFCRYIQMRIEQCIQSYSDPEYLFGENCYRCPTCTTDQPATKIMVYIRVLLNWFFCKYCVLMVFHLILIFITKFRVLRVYLNS